MTTFLVATLGALFMDYLFYLPRDIAKGHEMKSANRKEEIITIFR